jgi:hypothetical protein
MNTEETREALLATVGGFEAFAQSFSWRTMRDLKQRAERELTDGAELIEEGRAAIAAAVAANAGSTAESETLAAQFEQRAIRAWGRYQAAGARTASWFVTGPARFPVERNNKRMEIERRRGDELLQLVRGAGGWAAKRLRVQARQAFVAAVMAAPPASSEKRIGPGVVIECEAINRLQIAFDQQPSAELRAALKGRGFRWAPSLGVWQRQLTNNARWAAEAVLSRAA